MTNIFEYIPFIGGSSGGISGAAVLTIAVWTLIIIAICGGGLFFFFFLMNKKLSTKTYEIDHQTKKVRRFWGRIKKDKAGVEKYFSRKLKKFLPRPQQRDFYLEGNKDVLFFLKDNNGFHHSLRLPTWKEITKFYHLVYDVDLNKNNPHTTSLHDIFFLPNPHEDLNWLESQIGEADKEFKDTKWWQHPNIMVLGTAAICMIMFILTMILARKFA